MGDGIKRMYEDMEDELARRDREDDAVIDELLGKLTDSQKRRLERRFRFEWMEKEVHAAKFDIETEIRKKYGFSHWEKL